MIIDRRWARCFVAAGTVVLGALTVVPSARASGSVAIPAYSIRLEDQLLATLHYLPVTFTPKSKTSTTTTTTTTTTTLPTTTTTSGTSTTSSTTTTTVPPTTTTTAPKKKKTPKVSPSTLVAGTYSWRFPDLPPVLRKQWSVGSQNIVLKGALMHFQSVHGLTWTGSMDGTTWKDLVLAADRHQGDPNAWNYVYVSKGQPETAKVYVNGKHYFTTLVNTGVSAAPTVNGTFPVYSRFTTTTMSGTEPDGQSYSDPGIPWVSYFNGGDALHGFLRSSYGFPQSVGCVEMPYASAAKVWPRTPIGTLVTVQ